MVAELESKLANLRTTLVRVGDIRPDWTERQLKTGTPQRHIVSIAVEDREYKTTDRFMQSLAARFHVGREFFRYFTPDEVFDRVQQVHPRSLVRLTTDGDRALGMSNPARPIVRPGELCPLLRSQGNRLVTARYSDGIVTSVHSLDEANWAIGKDVFSQTYTFETPIDGFGLPSVYLSLIRLICRNGMIGYAPAFRTDIPLGKDDSDSIAGPLGRAMDCFSNEEGYTAFRDRLESARRSEASVYEVRMLCRALARDTRADMQAAMRPIYDKLWKLTGDISVKYGIASDKAISRKKQSMLPMDCTVYDLLTFATEVTTHRTDHLTGGRQVHAWVGQTLSTEFDLEGSLGRDERFKERQTPAFYLN